MYGTPLGGAYCGSHDCCREASLRERPVSREPRSATHHLQAMPHVTQQPLPPNTIFLLGQEAQKRLCPASLGLALALGPGSCKLAPDKVPGSYKLCQGLIALQGKVAWEAGRCWSHVLPRRGGPSGPLSLLCPPASLQRGRALSRESAIRSLLRVCKAAIAGKPRLSKDG